MEFRLQIKDEIADTATTMGGIEDVMTKVEQILQNQRHEPELFNIYLIFIFIFVLLIGIYATLKLTRNSIVTFLQKEAIQNARLGDLIPRPVDFELPISPENTKVLNKHRRKFEHPRLMYMLEA